ncbi:unnamed protein product [Brachionus calyciflorus]|uniref:Uncharacterized protein n=1 Tax=Brachionus calyciflorus TaxID=104777 RepID=A0A814DE03_9BILA|nr:unnamed protein product [Brachionus calyciflorus]
MTENRLSSSYYQSGSSSPTKGSTLNLFREDAENDLCKRCGKYIYPLELMGPVMGYKYHKMCFRCHTCDRVLDFINYRTNLIELNDRQLYCVNHYPKNGKYTESHFTYRAGAKSPAHFESHEYSEFYRSEASATQKFTYGNITGNLEDSLYYKNHLNKSQENILNTHEVGFLSRDRFELEERQRLEQERLREIEQRQKEIEIEREKLEIERKREIELERERLELERKRQIEIERERIESEKRREIELERERIELERKRVLELERERAELERKRVLELERERAEIERKRVLELERERIELERRRELELERERREIELKKQVELERERREKQLEEERLRKNVERLRSQSSIDENSVEGRLVNILTNIRNQTSTSTTASSVIINSATKDYHDVKEIPVHLNDSFNEPHEIKIIPNSSYSNLATIIQEVKRLEQRNSSHNFQTLPVYHIDSNRDVVLKDDNLKDIFQEARIADMERSQIVSSQENLRDIFYEAALATMNRSGWSAMSNADDSLELNDDFSSRKDENLKNVFWEANKANESRGSTTIIHSKSQENLNWSHAVNTYNTYSETVVQKQTYGYESTVISSNTNNSNNKLVVDEPIPNLKQMMGEVISHNNQTIKPNQIKNEQSKIEVQYADQENMSNVKKIVGDIQKIEGYKSPELLIADTESMSNLKKVVSEVIHTDVSAPIKTKPIPITPTTPVPTPLPTPKPSQELSMIRQNSDGRTLEEIRPEIIGDNKGLGVIRCTVQYDEIRDRLSITIHEARGLKNIDPKGMIDPYTRVYLQPDEKQKLKRKTKIVKNSINPKWQETFDYSMTQQEAVNKTLIINLKDERGFFEKPEAKFLGEIVMKLKSVPQISYPFTRWYYLQPLSSCSNILAETNGTHK